eukprot:2170452-Rhodomonas_salina.1
MHRIAFANAHSHSRAEQQQPADALAEHQHPDSQAFFASVAACSCERELEAMREQHANPQHVGHRWAKVHLPHILFRRPRRRSSLFIRVAIMVLLVLVLVLVLARPVADAADVGAALAASLAPQVLRQQTLPRVIIIVSSGLSPHANLRHVRARRRRDGPPVHLALFLPLDEEVGPLGLQAPYTHSPVRAPVPEQTRPPPMRGIQRLGAGCVEGLYLEARNEADPAVGEVHDGKDRAEHVERRDRA